VSKGKEGYNEKMPGKYWGSNCKEQIGGKAKKKKKLQQAKPCDLEKQDIREGKSVAVLPFFPRMSDHSLYVPYSTDTSSSLYALPIPPQTILPFASSCWSSLVPTS